MTFGRRRVTSVLAVLCLALSGAVVVSTQHLLARAAAPPSLLYRLDASFGVEGVTHFSSWSDIEGMYSIPNGSTIVLLIRRDNSSAIVGRGLVRLSPNGLIDLSFASSSGTPGVLPITDDGSVFVRANGTFLVGTRQYLGSGEPDLSFGVDGWATISGVRVGSARGAAFETANGGLLWTRSSFDSTCSFDAVDAAGRVTSTTPFFDTRCDTSAAAKLADGTAVVLLASIADGMYIVHIGPDGAFDWTLGGGTGAIHVNLDAVGFLGQLVDLDVTADDNLVVLAGSEPVLVKMTALGIIDENFGAGGRVLLFANQAQVVVESSMIVVATGQRRYFPEPAPSAEPALLRFLSDGTPDTRLNSEGGLNRGSQDLESIGAEPSISLAGLVVVSGEPSTLLVATNSSSGGPTVRRARLEAPTLRIAIAARATQPAVRLAMTG